MVHITDPDLLQKMAQLEGALWAFGNQHSARSPGILLGTREVQTALRLLDEKMAQYVGEEAQYWDEDKDIAVHVIYGDGGFHRYPVKLTGEVCFSSWHCCYGKGEKIEMAKALGFTVF